MQQFAEVCENIAATTKKLEKEKILCEYLRSLNDEDLSVACIFLSGAPFALRDQRTLNTGFAALRDALFELDPTVELKLGPALLKTGDPGEAIQELLPDRSSIRRSLTLQDALTYYKGLAGSSSNQERKRLTVEILAKASPVESKYLIKILLGGMRIGLQESLVETSIAKAFAQPPGAVQKANMLLGDIGETAVLARHGKLTDATMRLLHPLKPMLASPEEDAAKILEAMNGEGFAEDKYDGIRAQIHKQGSALKIYSRDLDDITDSFPDVAKDLMTVAHSFLMDGEIVPFRDGRILGFADLQKRLGRKSLTPEILTSIPCRYFSFDLLFVDDRLLIEQPLRARREELQKIQESNSAAFERSEQKVARTIEDIEAAFETSRNRNNEGLVIKDPESLYTPGKRGKTWLKLKRALITLDVVVTRAEYGHGKRRGVLSDYTFAVQKDGELLDIGKAYSGITDQELDQLSKLFHEISIEHHGYYHTVRPQVVLEVAFDRINRSKRHSSGFALRFPRIKRIRWDKTPAEIDSVETVEQLYLQHFAAT